MNQEDQLECELELLYNLKHEHKEDWLLKEYEERLVEYWEDQTDEITLVAPEKENDDTLFPKGTKFDMWRIIAITPIPYDFIRPVEYETVPCSFGKLSRWGDKKVFSGVDGTFRNKYPWIYLLFAQIRYNVTEWFVSTEQNAPLRGRGKNGEYVYIAPKWESEKND